MSSKKSKPSIIPFKYVIDLVEYVRIHAETVMHRELTDEEIQEVIHEYIFDSNGIHEVAYNALSSYADDHIKLRENDNPLSPYPQPPSFKQVMCPACEQTVPPKRLAFLQSIHKTICDNYKVDEPTVIPVEVIIRIDGSVVDHLNPDIFDLIHHR